MQKNIFSNKVWLNNYLSSCDLMYKYNVKSVNKIPKVQKINISFALQNKLYNAATKISNLNTVWIRVTFLFFYSLFLAAPLMKVKILSSQQGAQKSTNSNLFYKYFFSKQQQIDFFLFFFFIECWSSLSKQGYKLDFNFPYLREHNIGSNKYFLRSHVPLFVLPNYELFSNLSSLPSSAFDDSFLFITFSFSNIDNDSKKNCIKNLPLFWLND